MVSTHVQDFLSDALQEAIRIKASLCLFSHQVNLDETPDDDREITPTRLMWNHFAAMHNSGRVVRQCALDLSEEIEADALLVSALDYVLHLLDFIEGRSSLTSFAQLGMNEALETAVRAQASFEMLAGSWQTIRQMFKQNGDERKRNSSHQAARSASIAASCWRVLHEALLLERADRSGCERQNQAGDQKRRNANPLAPQEQAILDQWSEQEQEPCEYTLMADAGTNSFLVGCYMVGAWFEKAPENAAHVLVSPICHIDEIEKIVRAIAQISQQDPRLVVQYIDTTQPIATDGLVWLLQIDYAQALVQPFLDFYKANPPKRLLVSHEPTGQWIDPPAGMMQLLRHNSPAPLYWDVVPANGKGGQRFKDLRHNDWYDNLVTLFNRHSPVSDHYLVCMYLSILASEALSWDELPDNFWATGKVGQYIKTIRRRERKGMVVQDLLDGLKKHPEDFRGRFSHIMFELVRNGILRVPDYAEEPDLAAKAQRFRDAVLPIATRLLDEEGLTYP